MHDVILQLTTWIAAHPNGAGLIIFFSSFAESLAFVGLIMPGTVLMLATGALIAAGSLAFIPTMIWAICGAVLADGLSFWLGLHFKQHIRAFPLFRRFPTMLERGEIFFRRHGGKSVFLGRFIGPIRPVIPLVAGMMGMGQVRFTIYNIFSALVWAPAYLLPGMAFGASLALAGEVAGRLALLLTIFLGLLWFIFGLFRRIFRFVGQHWHAWENKLFFFISRSPVLQKWFADFFDKEGSYLRSLTVLFFLFAGAVWFFYTTAKSVVTGGLLVAAGTSLYHLLQGLRTPWGDTMMIGMTMLGDAVVTVPLAIFAAVRLLVKKDRCSALMVAVTLLGGFGLVTVIKEIFRMPRPLDLYTGAMHWAFPSSHATMSLIVYGFLALICSRSLTAKTRWFPFSLALFLVIGIDFSRLYLGAHWLADVVAGFCLGTIWLVIMTVVYLHAKRSSVDRHLFVFSCMAFLVVAAVHWSTGFDSNRLRYRQRHTQIRMSMSQWQQNGWQRLPPYRLDLGGEQEQLLGLQYGGRLPQLEKVLAGSGWHRPLRLTPATSLHWLMTNPEMDDLPVLPQFHDGRNEALLLVHYQPGSDVKNSFLALRFWPADVLLDNVLPLHVGTITRMSVHNYFHLLHLPRTEGTVRPGLLQRDLQAIKTIAVKSPHGTVLLIVDPPKVIP